MRERIVRPGQGEPGILYVRSRDDFEPVSEAVQAWADRVSDWP
jgi:hypothetical protein